MKTLIVDNYDSFTHNLAQLVGEVTGIAPSVVLNDHRMDEIAWNELDAIILSPGPGHPERKKDFGICADIIRSTSLPLLGVCLGHQGICSVLGGSVSHAPEPRHGRTSRVRHTGEDIFAGLPDGFEVVRYHSLIATSLPPGLKPIAWCDDGLLMGLKHESRPMWGVQFHPESICTEYGRELLDNFCRLARAYNKRRAVGLGQQRAVRPQLHVHRVESEILPADAFSALYADACPAFWLDSSMTNGEARFSFMGDCRGPLAEFVTYDVATQTVTTVDSAGRARTHRQQLFDHLNAQIKERSCPVPEGLPFQFNLGYVGYIGYELKAETGGAIAHRSDTADAGLLYVDRAIAYDHLTSVYYLLQLSPDAKAAQGWFDEVERVLSQGRPDPIASALGCKQDGSLAAHIALRHHKDEYLEKIRRCLSDICDGESYEICMTNMATLKPPLHDPLAVYHRLRVASPAPYGSFLRFPEVSVLSASPERFLSVDTDGHVESKPIKGTRRRGRNAEEDRELVHDLASNVKDRAENLMIVDLLRNDLNRVCSIGSVHVPKLFEVETYATLHQLVSTIRGRLQPGRSAVDCLKAAFPGGSMTGAPKVRTMEIIDALESGPRGIYSGAIGWFGHSGAADLSIVIRTIVTTRESTCFGIGGAIVALSDPQDEFEEILLKSRAMVTAIQAAPGQVPTDA